MDLLRLLLVDDFEPWCNFVSAELQKHNWIQIVGEISDGLGAVEAARELQPDLILLDIGLPSLNGIEAARRIREVSPNSKILFLSENSAPDIAEGALEAGGSGYVVKVDAGRELLLAVRAVSNGKRYVSGRLTGQISYAGPGLSLQTS
jgi:DNA-binding NarL/FixJ family response regulator